MNYDVNYIYIYRPRSHKKYQQVASQCSELDAKLEPAGSGIDCTSPYWLVVVCMHSRGLPLTYAPHDARMGVASGVAHGSAASPASEASSASTSESEMPIM